MYNTISTKYLIIAAAMALWHTPGCSQDWEAPVPQTTTDGACPADAACVQVNFPGPGQADSRPVAKPDRLVVSRNKHGSVSFGLGIGEGRGRTYVIFKCQNEQQGALDCRTPVVDQQGNAVWSFMLNQGQLKKLSLADRLERCEVCPDEAADCDSAEYEYQAANCLYHYMVVDLNDPGREPVDPWIEVDR